MKEEKPLTAKEYREGLYIGKGTDNETLIEIIKAILYYWEDEEDYFKKKLEKQK